MESVNLDFEECLRQVRDALSKVCDPELDEPVTDLGFVQEVSVAADGDVSIRFRLPTYWCSANFAYLMAADMRDAIASLPWIRKVNIELVDHFTSAEVSTGVSHGKSFLHSFQSEAEEDLEAVRLIFRRKSFQKRQESLLRHLLGRGETISAVVSMPLAALEQSPLDRDGAVLRARYLQARALLGFDDRPNETVFHDTDGKALQAGEFSEYLLHLRRVRLNTEFNSAICRGLLEARYGAKQENPLIQIEVARRQ